MKKIPLALVLVFVTTVAFSQRPITYMLVGIYMVGFLMLTPECSKYMGTMGVLAFDFVAMGIGVVLIRVIGKGIRQEMEDLWVLIELRKKLLE